MWDWIHLRDNTGTEEKRRRRRDVKNSRKKNHNLFSCRLQLLEPKCILKLCLTANLRTGRLDKHVHAFRVQVLHLNSKDVPMQLIGIHIHSSSRSH